MLTRIGIGVAVAACMLASPALAGSKHGGYAPFVVAAGAGYHGGLTYDRGRYSLNGYRGYHYAKEGYREYLGYWFPHYAFDGATVVIHIGPGHHGGYARKTAPGIYELPK